jgi:hypothetical protein
VTGGVLADVAIGDDSESGSKLVNDDWDPLSNHKCNHHDNIPEHRDAKHENDKLAAPSKINFEEMAE